MRPHFIQLNSGQSHQQAQNFIDIPASDLDVSPSQKARIVNFSTCRRWTSFSRAHIIRRTPLTEACVSQLSSSSLLGLSVLRLLLLFLALCISLFAPPGVGPGAPLAIPPDIYISASSRFALDSCCVISMVASSPVESSDVHSFRTSLPSLHHLLQVPPSSFACKVLQCGVSVRPLI